MENVAGVSGQNLLLKEDDKVSICSIGRVDLLPIILHQNEIFSEIYILLERRHLGFQNKHKFDLIWI